MLLQPVADENLKQYMSRAPHLSVEEQTYFRSYFGCLAHTIKFLHGIEMLHKDIKPENVLLKDGQLILTDFGTAFDWSKTGQSMTQSNASDWRTPRYQSPEAVHGEFRRASDIWSLGVVFLEMVTFLRGKTLAEMDTFLNRHGQGVTSIHNNIEGAMNWFGQLQAYDSGFGSPVDNEPLTWIKSMLNRVQSNRLTAEELVDKIVGFNDGMFCGRCCMDVDSSFDDGFESDDDMLSDISEYYEVETTIPSGNRQEDPMSSNNQSLDRAPPPPTFNSESKAVSGVPLNVKILSDSTNLLVDSQQIADTVMSVPLYGEIMSTTDLPDEPAVSIFSYRRETRQNSSKSLRSPKEASIPGSQKATPKPKSKTFRERETFVQWLASLPEKFAPAPAHRRSSSSRRSVSHGLRGPTVETQRIKHFLSSLPEEIEDFDDPPDGTDDYGEEDFQSSSHLLHEDDDDDQFADVGRSKLIHYASDGDLNLALAISKEALQVAKMDLKEFAANVQIPDSKRESQAINVAPAIHHQFSAPSEELDPRDQARAPPARPKFSVWESFNLGIQDPASIDPSLANTGDLRPSTANDQRTENVHEGTASAGGAPNSKVSVATKASKTSRLGDFIKKAPARRRRKFESATIIMGRILDDKSSEAPTSLMSVNTRAVVSAGLPVLRWNDKAYGYLPKFVASGKVGAVRECLKAGCNPGTEQKPRWAPVYNAVRGASDRHLKCLRELVHYGADVNVKRSNNGRTSLHYAVESKPWSGYSSVIYTLLAAGADPNIRDWANDLPLLMLLVGNGPLSQAKRDALFLLLAPNFATNLNVSVAGTLDNPLHLAIRRKDPYTVDAILEKLKSRGTASQLMDAHNGSGFTPLLLALTIFQLGEDSDEELQIIEYLLKHGANANDADATQGKTPLHLIIGSSKNTIALELLCRHSANPDLPDLSGLTATGLVRKLRVDYPQDRWYSFADRRMGNRLTAEHYRPPELEAFLAETAESMRAP
ncbi:hypothetical protein G7Y79_00012g032160 [Physcia stellaris]|nr:hypothetical protein G7Y79_00012g032160 [Physcia stellaris]